MIRAMAYCGPASDSSPKPDRFKKPPSGKNVRTLVSLPPIVVPLENQAMEVLVRLRNDLGEQLVPLEFLRAAERYRLMGLIDRWVVQTTLTALGRGAIALAPKRSIAINISGQTLADAQFLECVVECFDSTGANPMQICFEIAESTVVANFEQARRFVGG